MTRSRHWSEDEKSRLLDMRARGLPSSQIATALGRTRNSVCGAIERMMEEGRDVPPTAFKAIGGAKPKPPAPKVRVLPSGPFWEMDEDDRRLAVWTRAKAAAANARGNA